jgi:TonB family protein
MRRLLILALVAGSALPATPVHARETLRLQPSTPWVVDYAEESCRLARNFGEGKERVTLMMDQMEPGDWFRITLTGKPLRVGNVTRLDKARIRFGPNELETEISAQVGEMGDEPALLVIGSKRLAPLTDQEKEAAKKAARENGRFEPAALGPVREAAATWLELTKATRRDLVLDAGPMDKPLAALRTCSWDTIKAWGLDIEQQKTLTSKVHPKRSPATWFDSSDYPTDMLRGGYEGIVNFRLLVDASGKPSSCKIQTSTRPKEFDDTVCRAVMKRAEFEPALDARGKPVPSYWISTVNFRICC